MISGMDHPSDPPETSVRSLLLQRVRDFCAARGLTERQFSIMVNGDHNVVRKLRAGRLSLSTIERIEAVLDGRQPAEDAA